MGGGDKNDKIKEKIPRARGERIQRKEKERGRERANKEENKRQKKSGEETMGGELERGGSDR